jgi:hypothetical protein
MMTCIHPDEAYTKRSGSVQLNGLELEEEKEEEMFSVRRPKTFLFISHPIASYRERKNSRGFKSKKPV